MELFLLKKTKLNVRKMATEMILRILKKYSAWIPHFSSCCQSYIYQVLQTIQMKLILLCVGAEPAVLGSTKTALKFIYKI